MVNDLIEKYPEFKNWKLEESNILLTCDVCNEKFHIYYRNFKDKILCRCDDCLLEGILNKHFERKIDCILSFKDKRITKEALVNHNRIVIANYKQKVKEAIEKVLTQFTPAHKLQDGYCINIEDLKKELELE